jgi:hypothetical protein
MRILSLLTSWLKHHFWLKLAAVATALTAWYLASQVVYLPHRYVVPVELRLNEGMIAVAVKPATVTLVVVSPQGLALKPVLRRDLSQTVTPGKVVFSLTPADVSVSPRARLSRIEPSQVEVDLDRKISRVLPVKVVYDGSLRPGFRVAREKVTPPEVLVPGPENALKSMTEIETFPIPIAHRGGEYVFEKEVELRPPVPSLAIELEKVLVEVEIAPALTSRTLESIPVGILKLPGQKDEIAISPREVRLVAQGREDAIANLTSAEIKIFVDVIGLLPGSYELPLQTRLPAGVSVSRIEPSLVTVSLGRVSPPGVEVE